MKGQSSTIKILNLWGVKKYSIIAGHSRAGPLDLNSKRSVVENIYVKKYMFIVSTYAATFVNVNKISLIVCVIKNQFRTPSIGKNEFSLD